MDDDPFTDASPSINLAAGSPLIIFSPAVGGIPWQQLSVPLPLSLTFQCWTRAVTF